MTQKQMIVKYIKDFGSISPMEAFSDLGITKLATRVSELISDGEKIRKQPEKRLNRYGKKCRYMRYTME